MTLEAACWMPQSRWVLTLDGWYFRYQFFRDERSQQSPDDKLQPSWATNPSCWFKAAVAEAAVLAGTTPALPCILSALPKGQHFPVREACQRSISSMSFSLWPIQETFNVFYIFLYCHGLEVIRQQYNMEITGRMQSFLPLFISGMLCVLLDKVNRYAVFFYPVFSWFCMPLTVLCNSMACQIQCKSGVSCSQLSETSQSLWQGNFPWISLPGYVPSCCCCLEGGCCRSNNCTCKRSFHSSLHYGYAFWGPILQVNISLLCVNFNSWPSLYFLLPCGYHGSCVCLHCLRVVSSTNLFNKETV